MLTYVKDISIVRSHRGHKMLHQIRDDLPVCPIIILCVLTKPSVTCLKGKGTEIEYKQKREENSRRSKYSGT